MTRYQAYRNLYPFLGLGEKLGEPIDADKDTALEIARERYGPRVLVMPVTTPQPTTGQNRT